MIHGTVPRFVSPYVLLLVLLSLCVARGHAAQPCIRSNGRPGRCIEPSQCPEIAVLANRTILYNAERNMLYAVLKACGSNEYSANPIVCCAVSSPAPTTSTAAPDALIDDDTLFVRSNLHRDVLPSKCGFSVPGHKITSDVKDTANVFIWAVFLLLKESSRCVGSLIHESFVLTVAHCVRTMANHQIKMYIGLNDYRNLEECLTDGECLERGVTKIILHEAYDHHTSQNDIALIQMNETLQSSFIMPVCLPLDFSIQESKLDEYTFFATGWGQEDLSKKLSDEKGIVELRVLSQDQCAKANTRQRLNPSMNVKIMCTLGANNVSDVCNGDSGAPIMTLYEKKWIVVGLVSYGPPCTGEITAPGVATRISEYINWILININKQMKRKGRSVKLLSFG